eukprot:11830897-Heterocapsa_arctica.AAC.1
MTGIDMKKTNVSEEKEKKTINHVNSQQEIQQAEEDDAETKYLKQNKKPWKEEKQDCKHNMLDFLKKMKEDQDHYGSVQPTKKRKTDKKTDR